MKGYLALVGKLKEIKKNGYVKTHRSGNTGVGKTLEDLLGIKENNVPGPNAQKIELKSARKNVSSMLTLFTKSPLPRKINSVLLQRFGYASESDNRKKRLETTVNAIDYNRLKEKPGFKVGIENDRICLITITEEIVCFWARETLRKSFERKLSKLLYVKAESKGKGPAEEFWYNEAWLLSGFSFDNFLRLLREGVVVVDIRIGQFRDGRTHDHGTGFRVLPDKLDMCFEHREKIM